jgi:hypothetical protein
MGKPENEKTSLVHLVHVLLQAPETLAKITGNCLGTSWPNSAPRCPVQENGVLLEAAQNVTGSAECDTMSKSILFV